MAYDQVSVIAAFPFRKKARSSIGSSMFRFT